MGLLGDESGPGERRRGVMHDQGCPDVRRSNDGRDTLGKRWGMMDDILIGATLYKRRTSASFTSDILLRVYTLFVQSFYPGNCVPFGRYHISYTNTVNMDVRVLVSFVIAYLFIV